MSVSHLIERYVRRLTRPVVLVAVVRVDAVRLEVSASNVVDERIALDLLQRACADRLRRLDGDGPVTRR